VVWLYCMDDEREARLIRQSGEMTHANYDHPDKGANHSLSPGIRDWLVGATSLQVDRPLVSVKHYYGYRPPSLPVGYADIVVPPPKM